MSPRRTADRSSQPGARTDNDRRATDTALRETLDRLRFATRAANVGLWDWDLRTNDVVYSPEWKTQLGYDVDEIRGQYSEWESRLHPDDLAPSLAALQACLAGDIPEYSVEFRMRHKDGSWRWIHARGDVLRDDDGRPIRMLGCHIDITERRQSEQRRRESETRLLEAERVAHLGYWERDYERGLIRWSDEAYRIWGLEPGSRLDEPELMRRIHADDRATVLASIASSLEHDVPHDVEYRAVRSDGDVRVLHSKGELMRDAAGRPLRFFGTVQDITERRRAEQTIVESHNLLNAVLEGTDDAVFVKDLDGRYLMINSAAARNMGRPAPELVGRGDAGLWGSPDIAAAIAEQDREVVTTGRSRTYELDISVTDTPRFFLTRKSAFRDADGRVMGLIGISRDISEQKRLEDQFRQAQKMEAVGRLAGGVAHDFNNLLTVIHGFTQLVFDRLPSGDESREWLAEVIGAAERATNLTRQLLVFSRKQPLRPRTVDVNALVGDLLRLLRRLIGEDIEFSLTLHTAAAFTEVDPGQFEQAVINLAVNARDAMPGGGRLTIETSEVDVVERLSNPDVRAGRYVRVTVRDSGVGMDEATQARIFEPFFTTKGPGHGTGLGLAMVYGFVRQSGGFIDVTSAPRAGTTFDIHLPAASPPVAATEAGERESASWAPTGTETILIVEDETAVRAFARAVLESSGYTVLVARNGEEGLARAAAYDGRLDLLLTDLVMPKLGGRQLAEALCQSRPELKLLFMSGYSEQPVPLGSGGTSGAFLQKPFVALELVRKVRRVLDAPAVKLS